VPARFSLHACFSLLGESPPCVRYQTEPRFIWCNSLHVAEAFPLILNFKELVMLYTIAVILLVLWLLGMVSSTTIGGFIHILLVVAIVMVLLRLISGRTGN
jgi:hypothetical protein